MTNELLNQLLMEVDSGWQKREPVSLIPWIRELRAKGEWDAVADLLATDSEWRWRINGYKDTSEIVRRMDCLDGRTPAWVENYVSQFPEIQSDTCSLLSLIDAEFLSRSMWGNPPAIAEFVDRFPEVESLDQHLVDILDEQVPLKLTFLRSAVQSSRRPDFLVKTPLVIGRRSLSELEAEILSNDGRRLIVAENDTLDVSREHVRVTRTSVHRVLIANQSSQGRVGVNGNDLPSGAVTSVHTPATIEVGGKIILLEPW